MKLTENFHLAEFACKDGTAVPENLIPKTKRLAENLQVLRDDINEAVFLTSAYRTPEYNKLVGGAKHSQHPKGTAADINARSFTPKQLKARIEKLIKAGKMQNGGIGLYPGFVHYDIGPVRRW